MRKCLQNEEKTAPSMPQLDKEDEDDTAKTAWSTNESRFESALRHDLVVDEVRRTHVLLPMLMSIRVADQKLRRYPRRHHRSASAQRHVVTA